MSRLNWLHLLPLALAAAACGGDDTAGPPPEEAVTPGCRDATLPSTALYRVCFPQNWNGDLVVYAHGYVAAGEPLALPDDQVGGQSVSQVVNALGYAYATTSYRSNGLVADLAVDDVAELVSEVRARFRPDPSRTFVTGSHGPRALRVRTAGVTTSSPGQRAADGWAPSRQSPLRSARVAPPARTRPPLPCGGIPRR